MISLPDVWTIDQREAQAREHDANGNSHSEVYLCINAKGEYNEVNQLVGMNHKPAHDIDRFNQCYKTDECNYSRQHCLKDNTSDKQADNCDCDAYKHLSHSIVHSLISLLFQAPSLCYRFFSSASW